MTFTEIGQTAGADLLTRSGDLVGSSYLGIQELN